MLAARVRKSSHQNTAARPWTVRNGLSRLSWDAERGLFDAAYGNRADQAEGENASRWWLAPTDS